MGIATAVENRYIAQQVRAYQKGDKGAYGKLYSLTKDIVFGYIFPQIRNRDMAEDIVMDTYTAGMEKLKDLRDPNAFNKWITEIARTKLIDYTREEKRTHGGEAVAADFAIARESEKADGIVDPFADYAIELKTDLGRVVSGLEREYFAVVYLRYTCGLSISAISELEQIPEGTVKRRLQLAREKLRPQLKGFYSIAPFFFYRREMLARIRMLRLQQAAGSQAPSGTGSYIQSGAGKSALEKSAAGGLLYRKAAAAGAGIAVGAVTALMMQGPVIRSLRYYDQTVPVNTQRIECSVKSRWAVKEARIEGKDWPVTEENGIYTAEIPENGSFVFTVTDQLGQSVRQGFRIGNIDRVAPVYRNYTENGDMVVLRFGEGESEVMSGIDWDNSCFRDAKGNTVTPRAVNRQTDEALLPKDSFPLEAKVEDFAGNYGTYRLTLKTVTLNAEGGSHAE